MEPGTDRPISGENNRRDLETGAESAPICSRCGYNLMGSRQSERCPECGWQIDWDIAFRTSTLAGPPRWAVASLLACVFCILHFLLTFFLSMTLFAGQLSGLAQRDGIGPSSTPQQERMNEIIESFLTGAVHVLMSPMSILFPNRMSISHVFANSIIWGAIVAAALIALYDLRKRRRTRDR